VVGLLLLLLGGLALAVVFATHSGTHDAVAADQPLPVSAGGEDPASSGPSPAASAVVGTTQPAVPEPVPPTATPSGGVTVDVAGRVHHPGVVTVGAGSRVQDALVAAGGSLPGVDLSALDLASRLIDGEQIRVGLSALPNALPVVSGDGTDSEPAGSSDGSGTTASAAGPVDLNQATVAQLDALPGVGPVTAQRIVDWRTTHGRFTATGQLTQIQGLGGVKGKRLLSLVTLG
jgi:competence protein ComEA